MREDFYSSFLITTGTGELSDNTFSCFTREDFSQHVFIVTGVGDLFDRTSL
jgi:hypothetical protein